MKHFTYSSSYTPYIVQNKEHLKPKKLVLKTNES